MANFGENDRFRSPMFEDGNNLRFDARSTRRRANGGWRSFTTRSISHRRAWPTGSPKARLDRSPPFIISSTGPERHSRCASTEIFRGRRSFGLLTGSST